MTGVSAIGDGRHRIDFTDGAKTTAGLLVGADGASSKVRPLVTDAQPEYTSAPAQGPSVRFTVAGAPSLVVIGTVRIASDEDRTLSLAGQAYGPVNIGSDVRYFSLDNRVYVDGILGAAPDHSSVGKPKPTGTPGTSPTTASRTSGHPASASFGT